VRGYKKEKAKSLDESLVRDVAIVDDGRWMQLRIEVDKAHHQFGPAVRARSLDFWNHFLLLFCLHNHLVLVTNIRGLLRYSTTQVSRVLKLNRHLKWLEEVEATGARSFSRPSTLFSVFSNSKSPAQYGYTNS
jgi:hypothetical protein